MTTSTENKGIILTDGITLTGVCKGIILTDGACKGIILTDGVCKGIILTD